MMRSTLLFVILLGCIAGGSASSCSKQDRSFSSTDNNENNDIMEGRKISIEAGSKKITATLADNQTANAFLSLLPLTINMIELNRNEKYYDLAESLPVASSNPRTIQNGDLMLYGSKTLVLFYKSFSTSYSYTRIGRVDNVSGLEEALGAGNTTVTFRLQE